ncbi:alpha/beta hydrolase [Rothia nasimurium]|uniref:alpha/beta hydrolase n=1 Tax=Rothia nasimurium TaxID=85336 RepID=UPI002DD6AE35|nr:alpha/beta hydrolase [Rothia nasimurium]
MKKILSILLKLTTGLGHLITLIALLGFIGVLGARGNTLAQLGSALFPAAGIILTTLATILLLSAANLLWRSKRKEPLKKSLVILSILSFVALGFGGSEWLKEKQVVEAHGGEMSLLSGVSTLRPSPDEVITYATKDNQDLTLSVYQNPEKFRGQQQPVYVYIHGGGWSSGNSESLAGLHRKVADQGYVVFSLNYRLATEQTPSWDTATEDIADAMNWIRDNAAQYGGDADKLILSGESAGAHLDLLYTGLVSNGQLDAPLPAAVITMYPPVDLAWIDENARFLSPFPQPGIVSKYVGGNSETYPDRWEAVDVLNKINDNYPPVYIMHGEKDTMVNIEGSETFVEELNKAGGKALLVSFPYSNHAINQQAVVSLLNHFSEQEGLGVVNP